MDPKAIGESKTKRKSRKEGKSAQHIEDTSDNLNDTVVSHSIVCGLLFSCCKNGDSSTVVLTLHYVLVEDPLLSCLVHFMLLLKNIMYEYACIQLTQHYLDSGSMVGDRGGGRGKGDDAHMNQICRLIMWYLLV